MPYTGYSIGTVSVRRNDTGATVSASGSNSLQSFTMPSANVTVSVTFTPISIPFLAIGEEFYSDNGEFIFTVTSLNPRKVSVRYSYCYYSDELIIPSSVKGPDSSVYAVTSIEAYGFYSYRYAQFTGDLVIPESITDIGDYAFYNNTRLDGGLSIIPGVTTIGSNAFSYCGFSMICFAADLCGVSSDAFEGLLDVLVLCPCNKEMYEAYGFTNVNYIMPIIEF